MKKLKLDLDALTVESFATAADELARRGTVRGQSGGTDVADSCYDTCVAIGAPCGSEQQTYNESCVPDACPDSIWQECTTRDGHGCYYPLPGGGGGTY
jgi:hypothetical protein